MAYFKAFIRVVKSLSNDNGYEYFGSTNIIEERLIEADDKAHVKKILLDKYPQFFPTNKVYEKETKDKAQFFYIVIFPLYNHEINMINEGKWHCESCKQEYENKYINRPFRRERVWGELLFCNSDICEKNFISKSHDGVEIPDDNNYIKTDSPNYIYKVTEKATSKCYIGKTRNAPFFRWWNHLKHSSSPFGLYLKKTKLSEWTFEVLEVLPPGLPDASVFEIESKYIIQYDSIQNGFNSVISNKKANTQKSSPELF